MMQMYRLATCAGATALVLAATPSAVAEPPERTRAVVFVANAEEGSVSLLDATSFDVLRTLNVLPDGKDAEVGEDDPAQALLGQQLVEAAGGINYVQDQDLSPDGRTLYVSRGHRGDVAAFDLATGKMLWKVSISGLRADHMTLSADGARLYVSALTADVVELVDTSTGEVVDSFPTGEWPHDSHFSHDGSVLYNASIGNIVTPAEVRDVRAATPASPYVLTVVDAVTLEPKRTYPFARGIRPYVVTADDSRMFAQLSELHGLVEFDLRDGRELRRLELPVDEGVTEDDYSFEAPHHGLAMTADESTLCAAGRASDYVALVATESLEPTAVVEVGDMPSWAVSGPGDRNCFVANTGDDSVSVVSYAQRREVARVAVGAGPKHLELGEVPLGVLGQPSRAVPAGTPQAAAAVAAPAGRGLPVTGGGQLLPLVAVLLLAASWLAARRRTARREPSGLRGVARL
jgi:DNA-binding beta-propeller fold protein YncE